VYKTPTVAHEPSVEQVAGAGRLTDYRRYSYDTIGTTAGFRGVIMGLKVSMIRFQNPAVVPTA
jgi:hypothetical protein